MTVRDLIRLSLMRVNILQAGGTATPEDQDDAFQILNLWLDGLSAERLMIPFILRTLWTITSTKGTPTNPYTVGAGGDINVAKPVYVDQVRYLNNAVSPSVELPLSPMTADDYSALPEKTLTSTLPGAAYYQPTYAGGLGSLYLWPVPTQSSLQGVLYAPSAVAQFATVNDTVIVPNGYKKFLVDGLAVELASTLRENLPVDQGLIAIVRALKSTLKTVNTPQLDMGFDPAVSGAGCRSNIYTGIS